MLRKRDQGASSPEDAGFFAGDFGDGRAEVVLVVEGDVGDDGEEGRDDVGGVETAAEADFEDGDVEVLLGEVEEGEGGEGLEKAGVVGELAGGDEAVGGGIDVEVEAGEGLLGNLEEGLWWYIPHLRIEMWGTRNGGGLRDADAFGGAGEVGRGVEAGAKAGGGEDGGEGGRGRALAVGSGDEAGGEALLGVAEGAGEGAHVFERKLAAGRGGRELRGEAEQMVDRRCVGHEDILERLGRGILRLMIWLSGSSDASPPKPLVKTHVIPGEERRVRAGGGAAAVGAGAGVPQEVRPHAMGEGAQATPGSTGNDARRPWGPGMEQSVGRRYWPDWGAPLSSKLTLLRWMAWRLVTLHW